MSNEPTAAQRAKAQEIVAEHHDHPYPLTWLEDAIASALAEAAQNANQCGAEFFDDWICGLLKGHDGNHGGLTDERCREKGIPLGAGDADGD
jgi:hypothetical protein